jgi:tetratricopeptide (TPR) repeat protein
MATKGVTLMVNANSMKDAAVGSAAHTSAVAKLLADADGHRSGGHLTEAEAGYLAVLENAPGHLAALVGLGHIAQKRHDGELAVARFREAAARHPSIVWPRAELGLLLREIGRSEEAEKILLACLADAACPLDLRPTLLVPLGCLVRDRGDLTAAVNYFTEAQTIAPSFRWAQLELARTLIKLNRFDEAEVVYQATLSSTPNDLEALNGLGHVARKRGDRAEALARFCAAVDAHPYAAEPRAEMAVELGYAGRLGEAAEAYCALLSQHPDHSWAWIGFGHICRGQGDRAQAKAAFAKAMAIDPDNVNVRLEYANEARDIGSLSEAIGIARQILKDDPRCAAAYASLGHTLSRSGDHQEAVTSFQQAMQLEPGEIQYVVQLADCYQRLGNLATATALLSTALEMHPTNVSALIKLGDLSLLDEDPEIALGYYRRAVLANQSTIGPYLGISNALMYLGEFDESLAVLGEGERQCGLRPELAVRRSEIMRRIGRLDLARDILRDAAKHFPGSFWLRAMCIQTDISLGDTAAAKRDLTEVTPETVRERALWYFHRGQLAEAEWRLDEAMDEYRTAVALDPDESWPHHELARVSLLNCDFKTAREHLREYVELTAREARRRGRSTNISQCHLGQILDEFLLDRGVIAAIRKILELPTSRRAEAFADLAFREPDSTSAAIMFLISLRREGSLSRGIHLAGPSPIPRSLVQYWDTTDLAQDIAELTETWRTTHPDFRYALFDDRQARNFIASQYSGDVLRAYARSIHPAQKADLFRLAWLFAKGGYYVDADDRCVGRIGSIVPGTVELAIYQEEYGTVANNFVAVTPQHPVMGRALSLAVAAVNRGDSDLLWLSTGPALLTRALVQVLTDQSLTWAAWLERIAIIDRWDVRRVLAPHCVVAYKKTERHWSRWAFGSRPAQPF